MGGGWGVGDGRGGCGEDLRGGRRRTGGSRGRRGEKDRG